MKRTSAKIRSSRPRQITILCCAAVCLASEARAAEFELAPSLAVSEEFNDNIHDSASNRRTEWVTRLQPGAAILYRTPALSGDLNYHFDYQKYARHSRDDEKNHYLALRGSAQLLDNFLFIEVSDILSRVSLDVARDVTTESLFTNQTDQNTAMVSPYLLWRLGAKSTLKTGYRFTDTSYWGSPGIDRRRNEVFAELRHEPFTRVSISAGYSFGAVRTDLVDYDQHDASLGFRYEYAEKSYLFGGIGNSWQSFSDERSVSNLFWNAGVNKDFGLLVATLETRVRYTEDPLAVSTKETVHSVAFEKALTHGAAGISTSYSEFEDTSSLDLARRRTAVNGFFRHELSPGLNLSLLLTGDRVTRSSAFAYPYHFSGSLGASYAFNYGINASLNYSYIEYRHEWDSSLDARQTNRVVLALSKVF